MSVADAEAFKAGMRHLAAHVCLITTVGPDGARRGLTATAVCSVSADPPTLLCCVNRQIAPFAAIRESGIFAVNVLGVQDLELAERFAGEIQGEARFDIGNWIAVATGAPALESALTTFDCRMTRLEEVATHGILFGEIQAIRSRGSNAEPLLYSHGTFGAFAPLQDSRLPIVQFK
jgi:flavin reductase (DIM6/NTAB) family NADH-FMN oxidoreductase RutF